MRILTTKNLTVEFLRAPFAAASNMYIYSKIKYTVVVLLGRCMVLVWRNINEQKKEPAIHTTIPIR
jgi:hypothetical protein